MTDKEEAHEDAADGLARLGKVIILDGGGDLRRPFSTHRFRRFGVLEDLEVVLLLDLERDPVVDAQLEQDDRRVKDARVQEHGRVFKVDLARDLWVRRDALWDQLLPRLASPRLESGPRAARWLNESERVAHLHRPEREDHVLDSRRDHVGLVVPVQGLVKS